MDKKPTLTPTGVVHDTTPQPQPPITNRTQASGEPVDPIAVHDNYPPIGEGGITQVPGRPDTVVTDQPHDAVTQKPVPDKTPPAKPRK